MSVMKPPVLMSYHTYGLVYWKNGFLVCSYMKVVFHKFISFEYQQQLHA